MGLAFAALVPLTSAAQVPLLGRYQEFVYSMSAVQDEAAQTYHARLAVLSRQGLLDDDHAVLLRVRRIGAELTRTAIEIKPEASGWVWEFHTSSSTEELAYCTAGGKLLVSSAYVRALALTDGELATLIGHEVAHAIAEHQREILSKVYLTNAARLPLSVHTAMERFGSSWSLQIRLGQLSRIQESEADQLGMMLAYQSGWPTSSMVRFYQKLARLQAESVADFAFPPVATRLAMAITFARWHPHQAASAAEPSGHPAG